MRNYIQTLRCFNRNLRLFFVANAILGFVAFGINALLMNLYLLRLGYGADFIGQVNAAGPLTLAIASLPAGAFSQRYGIQRGLRIGFLFNILIASLLPLNEFLPSGWQKVWILSSAGLSWACGALILVNLPPFLMAATADEERKVAFSVQAAIWPFFGFVGNLVGGLLPGLFAFLLDVTSTQAAPYRLALLLASAINFLAVLAIWQMKEVAATPVATRQEQRRGLGLPWRVIGVVTLISILRIGGEYTMRVFFNVYLDSVLATPTALIGLLLAAGQLLALLSLLAPAVMARFSQERILIGTMLGMALAFLPVLFMAHWLAVGVSFIGMIGLVAISGPVYQIYTLEAVQPQWHTAIASATSMAAGISIATIALGGGYVIVGYGYPTLFALGALLALVAALLFGVYFRKARSPLSLVTAEVGLE
ncbi:MAG: MFS transporter [Caldilinea sp. CFX5]|nr:MFS transporter [Caldilinea sp. CFX5]